MDKILVVDDENINLMMVNKILGSDYQVNTVHSGEEALEFLVSNDDISLILLDIHMPGIDGYETLQRIREQEKLAKVPVIFLTADDDSKAEIHGFELGADDFIKKPFVSAVVRRRVERSVESFHLHCNLQNEVRRQTERAERRRLEVETLSLEIIQTLATAIDAKDIYTKGHSVRVAEYSAMLAKQLGWDDARIEKLRYKALLHDVGKIGVPDRILNKSDRLTDEEFEIIKSHTVIGADILKGISSLSGMYEVAKNHHERYDGRGYPEGLSATNIPEEARVVGIADSYDAMSSDRVYRKALPDDVIRQELINGRGKQFDPEMLDAFLVLFEAGTLKKVIADARNNVADIDIESKINDFMKKNQLNGAVKLEKDDIDKVLTYVSEMRILMNGSRAVISLKWDKELEEGVLTQATNALEYSMEQSLRRTDIIVRISASQYVLIFEEKMTDNVRMVIERIFAGFYRNCHNMEVKPVYEIR